MIESDGRGDGFAAVKHQIGSGIGSYDGDGFGDGAVSNWGGSGSGKGHSCGLLDGGGVGCGVEFLNPETYNESATVLIINDDPITTAYQAVTMQTLGDHYAEK